MAGPSRGGKRPYPPRRAKTDLTGVLTPEEKQALVSLIIEASNKIERTIVKGFETTFLPTASQDPQFSLLSVAISVSTCVPTHNGTGDNKENKAPAGTLGSINRPVANSTTQPAALKPYSRAHVVPKQKPAKQAMGKTIVQAQNNLIPKGPGIAQHDELKKELLVFFKKWQSALQVRVKDLSVGDGGGPSASSLQQGGKDGGRSARGNRGDRGSFRGAGTASTRNGTRGGRGSLRSRSPGQTATPPPNEIDPYLARSYPPLSTWLCTLSLEKRKLLLHTTMLLVLSLEAYSAFTRTLMLHVTSSLCLPLRIFQDDEARIARGLGEAAGCVDYDAVLQQKSTESKKSRKWKAAGAALMTAAGNLAKPLAAAGIGSVAGGVSIGAPAAAGLLGTVAHNGIVVGNMFGIYAGRDTGKMLDQYGKDTANFALIPVNAGGEESACQDGYRDARLEPARGRRMKLVIGLVGWVTDAESSVVSFQCLGSEAENYVLRYEVDNLSHLGSSLEQVVKSAAWTEAKPQLQKRSVLTTLVENKWPESLVRISKVIDNPWTVGMVRCEKAGLALAECIGRKIQGERPVSLIGYSLGARVIYTCLMALAERRQFGLVESAVMIGAPAPSDARAWLAMRSAVSGRLVNVFAENDYVLGFLYRTCNIQYGVAGLQPVRGAIGVENYKVSSTMNVHLRYPYMVSLILSEIGWEDLDTSHTCRDEAALAEKEKHFAKSTTRKSIHLPLAKDVKPVREKRMVTTKKENMELLESCMAKMEIQS